MDDTGVDFKMLFESTPNQYLVLDPQLHIIAVSEAYLRVTATCREEILGKYIFDVFPVGPHTPVTHGVSNLQLSFESVLKSKSMDRMPVQRYDIRQPASLGGQFVERYWTALNIPILERNGDVKYILHQVEDVTEAQRDQMRLRMLESVVTSGYDAVVITEAGPLDPPGPLITYVNEAFTEMTGYSPSEVIGHSPRFMQGPATDPEARAKIREALEHKKSVRLEILNYTKAGKEFWNEISIVPVVDKFGACTHFTSVQRDVTERRNAQDTMLRLVREETAGTQSEAARKQVTNILESIGDAFFALDIEWKFTYLNHRAEEFLGKKKEELLGKRIWEKFPELLETQSGKVFREAMRNQTKVELEDYSPKHKQWFDVNAYPSPNGLSVYFRDVTDRKQAEIHQQRLTAILEATPDFVASLDVAGHPLYLNRAVRDVLGITPDKDSAIFITEAHPDWAASLILSEGIPAAIRDGSWTGETAVIGKDGKEIPVSQVLLAHREHTNEVQYFSTIARDLTERKRIEKSQQLLVEATKALTSTLEFEPMLQGLSPLIVPTIADFCVISLIESEHGIQPVSAIHVNGEKTEVLRKGKCCYGHKKSPVGVRHTLSTGKSELVTNVTDPWMIAASQNADELKILRDLQPRSIMIVPMIAHGKTLGAILFASSLSGRAFKESDLVLAEELTSRVAFAAENARLYRESQQATHTRDEVLRIVAHDLRNPVAAISLNTDSLLHQLPEAWQFLRKQLELINRSAEQANRLIQDLLDVARMEARQLNLERKPLQTCALVQEAVDLNLALAEKKGVRLIAEVHNDLPAVLADKDRLLQVFSNLIGNAIKFTPAKGTITVQAEQDDSRVKISISDTGPGIPENQLAHLFDPFWQAKKGSRDGAGLGLAIAKGIVEAHSGRIWVESVEKKGTTFYFEIPVSQAILKEAASKPAKPAEADHKSIHGAHILVVDDSSEMLVILRGILERAGMVVTEAKSVNEALKKVEQDRPDVVITDIELPDGKGYDVVEKFQAMEKADGVHTPVAALTGHSSKEEIQKIDNAGFDARLSKPVTVNTLISSIQKMVDRNFAH